jgi:hypothetical protein
MPDLSPLWEFARSIDASGVLATVFYGLLVVLFAGAVHTRGRS